MRSGHLSSAKYLYAFLSILTLCAYSFIVFAAAPTGGYTPGSGVDGTLDPACAPGDPDCFVNVGWVLDPTLGYVYNTTDSIGIGDATPAAALTVGNGDLFQVNSSGAIAAVTGYIQGSGTMSLTSANTTQTTTGSIFALNGNSLSSGTGFYATSSSLTSGSLASLVVNSTLAASSTQKVLNISTTGVNATAGQRTYGAYIINSHSGGTAANVALYASASGGTTNYAALFPAGNVGIGMVSPTSTLDVLGQIAVDESLNAASSTTSLVHVFSTTLSATANTTGSSYVGTESLLTWDGGAFDATSSGALGMSASLSYAETDATTSGDIDLLIGANGFAVHNGSGTVSRLRGNRFSALNAGTGTVADLIGSSTSTNNSSTGAVTAAMGSNVELTNSGAGTTTSAIGSDLKVIASAGAITTATGLNLRAFASGTGAITTATGILVQAGEFGTYQPGIEATGTASGIYFNQTSNLGTDYAAVAGADVYGIYFGDKSLTGSNSEYGLYIDDAEAENYFLNGLRIGGNADANKFASASNGASSTVMYIGNETIDTSVSDRRLKTDIADASDSAIDFINEFSVKTFEWLPQNDRHDHGTVPFGLIAQEVEDIAPQYVRAPEDPSSYMSVRFGDLVPATIKAIQELDVRMDAIDESADAITANETLFEAFRNWFADTANGITKLFAGEIETKTLCVADDNGEKTCITKSQLDELLAGDDIEPQVTPDPETDPDPEPEPEIEPETQPESDVVPDPEPTPETPIEPDPVVLEV